MPTVLDDDLNLTVQTEDDLVVMTADPADGLWYFDAKEVCELAAAIVDHADGLDASYDVGAPRLSDAALGSALRGPCPHLSGGSRLRMSP